MDSSTLSFLIKDLFKSKGFDLVGFSKIQQMKDFDYMKDWLENGYHADYLSIGKSFHWQKYDYLCEASAYPVWRHIKEFYWVWFVLAKYAIVHSHFMLTVGSDGWELPFLKKSSSAKFDFVFLNHSIRDFFVNFLTS